MVFQPDSLPHSPPLSLSLPLYFLCLSIISSLRSTSPSTHRTIYLFLYLPATPLSLLLPFSPTSPALIHLSDFTGTLGDPGQTSCRGNRQSRIFYFFILYFFSRREEERERGWRASERQLMYLTETDRKDEAWFQGDVWSVLLFAYISVCERGTEWTAKSVTSLNVLERHHVYHTCCWQNMRV